jgi:error-prone DNA polymerase
MAYSPETPGYVELQVTSNFSFLRGASHPQELAIAASGLGLAGFALADRNSLAGVVRAHTAAKEAGVRFVVGARLDFRCGRSLLTYPTDRVAYGRLAKLITLGRRRAPKGECHLDLADLDSHGEGLILVALPEGPLLEGARLGCLLEDLAGRFPGHVYLAGQHLYRGDDRRRLARLARLAERRGTPLLAVNDVHAHEPARRPLQDVLTCIREHCTIDEAGYRLFANAERHLKSPAEMASLFADHPDALASSLEILERCRFSLDELRYEYPDELTHEGRAPQQELIHLTWQGAAERYADGLPERVRTALEHELALIGQLDYAPYFLTVHDVVRFARSKGILCQGRGSAANSAVCYCLGVTSVDPAQTDLLFERFISAARNEPPDIDVDFEHERREEVIQYIYAKYGRERSGLAATVICYRSRSALREVGKAMGLSADTVAALAGAVWGWSNRGLEASRVRELGLDPDSPRLVQTLALAAELIGFPRHLSQHVGGFVMTRGPLEELVPIENAAMADRTVVEWDKDDLTDLGILKVDILALGMLTCLSKGFELLRRHYGRALDLAGVPHDDPAVYEMLGRADSVGVFQVESRAQMTMLPRLKPKTLYDLVIEVAIVRPGPIQGDMVHPYLRRRDGREPVVYPSKELEAVLGKTLGVPLFQEQAMRIAIVAAGFTPEDADRLRRAMASFRKSGTIHNFEVKMVDGMVARGYDRDFAERCFHQIEGFGEYGFPESHAASFAQLAYVSAWMKCHYPAVFACALLNSQPMGFYAPAQIVRDAIDHGVETRPPDVNYSDWDCTLELAGPDPAFAAPLTPTQEIPSPAKREREGPKAEPWEVEGGYLRRPLKTNEPFALRLGLRQIKGLGEEEAKRLVEWRGNGYADVLSLWRRAALFPRTLAVLARADACRSLGLDRREALWALKGLGETPLPLFAAAAEEEQGPDAPASLPRMSLGEHVSADYTSLQLSLKQHPLALLRQRLSGRCAMPAEHLSEKANGDKVGVAGLVLVRQRPGTASGVIFATIEDETGTANLVIWPKVFERHRRIVLTARLIGVVGRVQREGLVIHIVAQRLIDLSHLLSDLARGAAPAPAPLARADEVRRPGRDLRNRDYRSRDFH